MESQYWPSVAKDHVTQDLRLLSSVVANLEEGAPILISEDHFVATVPRSRQCYLLKQIALEVPCIALR